MLEAFEQEKAAMTKVGPSLPCPTFWSPSGPSSPLSLLVWPMTTLTRLPASPTPQRYPHTYAMPDRVGDGEEGCRSGPVRRPRRVDGRATQEEHRRTRQPQGLPGNKKGTRGGTAHARSTATRVGPTCSSIAGTERTDVQADASTLPSLLETMLAG
jgi:hypothetical protein